MNKPQLELADVVRRFAGPYKQQFGHLMLPSHHRALQDIAGCMTEAMGGLQTLSETQDEDPFGFGHRPQAW